MPDLSVMQNITQNTSQEVLIAVLNEKMRALEHKVEEQSEELSALRKENNESLKQVIAEISALRENHRAFIKTAQIIKWIIVVVGALASAIVVLVSAIVALVPSAGEFIKQLVELIATARYR